MACTETQAERDPRGSQRVRSGTALGPQPATQTHGKGVTPGERACVLVGMAPSVTRGE